MNGREHRASLSWLVALATLPVFSSTGFAAGEPGPLGRLETPQSRGVETGIGLISGWHCGASEIQVRVDDAAPIAIASGTPREDTREACGHPDTGFGVLFNYNLLDPGRLGHEVVAYADGVEFHRVTFRVLNLGGEYLRGLRASCVAKNFPSLGQSLTAEWNESIQNFSMTFLGRAPEIDGVYYGARSYHHSCRDRVRAATFIVRLTDSEIHLTEQLPNGEAFCKFQSAWIRLADGSIRSVDPSEADCADFGGSFGFTVDGVSLHGTLKDTCGVIIAGAKLR